MQLGVRLEFGIDIGRFIFALYSDPAAPVRRAANAGVDASVGGGGYRRVPSPAVAPFSSVCRLARGDCSHRCALTILSTRVNRPIQLRTSRPMSLSST